MAANESGSVRASHSFADKIALNERRERAQQRAVDTLDAATWAHYRAATDALSSDPRRIEIAACFAEVMPPIAAALGVQSIDQTQQCVLQLSNAARSVVVLLLSKLPVAVDRLNSPQAYAQFLTLCADISSKAPSGLNPFLENLDYLLDHLSSSALGHWARWGAQAYSGNYYGQLAYFRLQSEPAKTLFQQYRSGSLFVDQRRKLHYFTRALWGQPFNLQPLGTERKGRRIIRPAIEAAAIKLPDAYDDFGPIGGAELYMAATVHAAAHLLYCDTQILADDLTQAELFCIALFSDAQIESAAISRFPGFKRLWMAFFQHYQLNGNESIVNDSMLDLSMRMGRALLDQDYTDPQPQISALAQQHHQQSHQGLNAKTAQNWGAQFYDWLRQQTSIVSLRDLEEFPLPYRTDHKHLWTYTPEEREFVDADFVHDSDESRAREGASGSDKAGAKHSQVAETDEATQAEPSEQALPIPYELLGLEAPASLSDQAPGVEHYYDEWDYALQLMRPKWATVVEREVPGADAALIDGILAQHKGIGARLRFLIDAMQPQGLLRKRGYEDGEQIDIDAAIRAMIDIRRGIMPDPKINIRISHHERDISILLLLDLSQSTNDRIDGTQRGESGYREAKSILDLTREATGLLAWAIDSIGDSFAVHGFSSDGRSDVRYFRFKDFDQDYDHAARARLASMRGSFSTRMGAALRHGGAHLAQNPEEKKLILLITDGAPSDIDEKDPETLRQDTKKAVEELRGQQITTFCVTLDPKADRYVADIFGNNHYTIVDDVEALPTRLTHVFAALTR